MLKQILQTLVSNSPILELEISDPLTIMDQDQSQAAQEDPLVLVSVSAQPTLKLSKLVFQFAKKIANLPNSFSDIQINILKSYF